MRNLPDRIRLSRRDWRTRLLGTALLLGLALVFGQCGGGGSSGSSGFFDVLSFSATLQSPRVYLNDSIEIVFNQPVDPRSVFSGVYIYPSVSAGSKRARGEFRVEGSKIIFTPALPTDPNFTNGGLLPDMEYTICIPVPGASCSVHLQNSPGLKSASGRGLIINRVERFLTVRKSGSGSVFRPEVAPQRPAVASMIVKDASGVNQVLNPIVNLVVGQTWNTGIYTTIASSPPTTLIPNENRNVPRYHYAATVLDRQATGSFNPNTQILSKDPLTIIWTGQPIALNEFQNKGGVLKISQASPTTLEASWAVDFNTTNQVVTFGDSGPPYDAVGFSGPLTAELTQGITRQVSPGDVNSVTEIQIALDEALNPPSATVDNFQMWKVYEDQNQLKFELVPPASTLKGSSRLGLTHEVVNGKSVVTLRPKTSFPQSKPNDPVTIVVTMRSAQYDDSAAPNSKGTGTRDLNDFPVAYPERTGWVLNVDANNNPTTVALIDRLPYVDPSTTTFPEFIQVMWAFQTRADAKVVNAVVESFTDRLQVSTECHTTAAWTKPGQQGLFATYGYGGSGELGNVVISGAVTFDSDTMTPGPGGVVEMNFNRLTVATTGNITLKGKYAFRINALETILIEGKIDASGQTGLNAPAGAASVVGTLLGGRAGPGAGAGGDSNTNPNHPIGALPMELRGGPGWPRVVNACGEINRSENRLISPFEPNCGGGTGGNRGLPLGSLLRSGCSGNGGGHEKDGVQTDYVCSNVQANGGYYGERWVVTSGPNEVNIPSAGTGGGAGGNAAISTTSTLPKDDIVAGSGGGGGGGVEFVAAGAFDMKASASILGTGGSGGNGYSTVVGSTSVWGGWGAGGSGGSVWLSGTSVTVDGGATIDARGGTGNPNPTNPARTGDGGDGYVIIRDRGGSPTVGSSKITPKEVTGRDQFSPASNGKSTAYSDWYDSGVSNPNWTFDASDPQTGTITGGKDLTWLNPPGSGQTAKISFQGAPDLGGSPNPNPTSWFPAGNTIQNPCAAWETDIAQIRGQGNLRYIKFKIEFDIGTRDKGQSPPNQIAIQRIIINFQRT